MRKASGKAGSTERKQKQKNDVVHCATKLCAYRNIYILESNPN